MRMEFRHDLVLREFCLDEKTVQVNHGAFGTVPRIVLDQQIKMLEQCEKNSEKWFTNEREVRYLDAVSKVAEFIGCRKENLVLIDNATTGTNAVMKSLKWKDGDAILISNHAFMAVKNLVKFVANENEAVHVITLEIPLPVSDENDVIDTYAKMIDKHPEIQIAMIDHITSSSALLMPLKRLVDLCHDKGILVCVDGAHAPGQLQLDLEDLGAEFYVGNLHKWMFCPRGCAFLWIHPDFQDKIHPVITSHNQFSPSMQLRYCIQGTRDAIPILMAPYAIDFHRRMGGMTQISEYNTTLLKWAVDMLTKAWNSKIFPIVDSMKAPYMLLVGLPDTVVTRKYQDEMPPGAQYCKPMIKAIGDRYDVYTAISFVMGKLWCRVSSQICNCKEDYFSLRDAVLGVTMDTKVEDSVMSRGTTKEHWANGERLERDGSKVDEIPAAKRRETTDT